MIEVSHLHKRYGAVHAVRDVSFEVAKGAVVGFLGPNGAGKSTTLRILAGFLGATEGSVRIAGHDILEERLQAIAKIGYMPETSPLYPEMRVYEYLRFRAELKGVKRKKRAAEVDRVLTAAKVRDMEKRLIGQLSKGYRQRVGLADALIGSPPLLILDEPTAGLDPNQIQQVRTLIQDLSEEHTILLSTHILSEVEATCHRVVIINEGKIVANDTPEALKRQTSERTWFDVKVKGAANAVAEAIGNVSGVAGLTATGDAGGVSSVRFESHVSDGEIGPAVVTALSGAGLELVSLVPQRASLEDVFRVLTRAEDS